GKASTRTRESIQLVGQIREAWNPENQSGHEVRVTVVRGGKSINGYYYGQDALAQIARLVEGARAYADHGRGEADRVDRSVPHMVGFYKDAIYLPGDVETPLGRVEATLHT